MSGGYDGLRPDYTDQADYPSRGGGGGGSRPGPATGRASIPAVAGLIARPNQGMQIVRWLADDADASPLVLTVDVRSTGNPTPANPFAGVTAFMAGGDGVTSDVTKLLGVLRITYGVGVVVRQIDLDLRPGTYQLPVSSTCTAEAFTYGTLGSSLFYNVSVSISPGITPQPSRPMNTAPYALAAGATATVQAPWGARWMGLWALATGLGAGQPQVSLVQNSYGPAISLDYVNGAFLGTPGQMMEMTQRATSTIKNFGATTAAAIVRFGLEF